MNLAEGIFLAFHIGNHVAVRGLNALVPEPYCDSRYVHAGLQHAHCGRMAKDVRRDLLAHQGRLIRLRPLGDRIDSAARSATGQMGHVASLEEDRVPIVGVNAPNAAFLLWRGKRPSPRIHNDQEMDSKERRRPQLTLYAKACPRWSGRCRRPRGTGMQSSGKRFALSDLYCG